MSVTLPVLMYHSVAADPPPATRGLSVHPTAFAEQLRLLRENGHTGLTFGHAAQLLHEGTALPPRPVVITFDDGYADMHQCVLPLLEEFGFAATLFVTTGWIRDAGAQAAGLPLDRTLSWGEIVELADAGLEIGAHSHSHPQLDQLPDVELRAELALSKTLLEQRLGRVVPSFAYPFGYSSRRVRKAVAAAGYRQAAAVANTLPRRGGNPYVTPRLTVRRATAAPTFRELAVGRRVGRTYVLDRVLTAGFLGIRRTRSLLTGASRP
jgi:peptidoglycan/xylan/chitin deacetylase (PgdA/CDA1 family)